MAFTRADSVRRCVRIGFVLIGVTAMFGCTPAATQNAAPAHQPRSIPPGYSALGRPPAPDVHGTVMIPTTGPINGF
jgi:hypothetical protein